MGGTQQVVFRIFTEDNPTYRHACVRILSEHGFPHSTVVGGTGYGPDQGGKPEHSLVLDIAVEKYSSATQKRMVVAVEEICRQNRQISVLLVRIPATIRLVRSPEAGYYEKRPSFWGRRESKPPEPDYRGRIIFASGDWKKLLKPELNAIRRGMVVGFFSRSILS